MSLQILLLALLSTSVLMSAPSGSDHTMDIRQDLFFVPCVQEKNVSDKVLTFKSPCTFKFDLPTNLKDDAYSKGVIENITEFYRYKIFHHALVYCETSDKPYMNESEKAEFLPDFITVNIEDPKVVAPTSKTDESYELKITHESMEISAKTYVGYLRALETFSQAVWFDDLKLDAPWYFVPKAPMTIKDHPEKSYRGIFLDATIHYFSKCALKKMMDGMMYSKINVLHLLIGSDHSFPFESKTYPNITFHGAFSEDETYSHETLSEIIEYATTRGVRVLLDLGLPNTARALTLDPDMKDIIGCIGPGDQSSPYLPSVTLNPLLPKTTKVMKDLLQEIADISKDDYLIIGSLLDNKNAHCWDNTNFTDPWKAKDATMFTLADSFFKDFIKELRAGIDKPLTFVMKSDGGGPVLEKYTADTNVAYIFEQDSRATAAAGQNITSMHRKSHNLGNGLGNYKGEVGNNFNSFRSSNLNLNVADDKHYQGGEITVQGDLVNDQSLEFYLWGRAAAATETMWTKTLSGGMFRRHGALEMRYNARGIKAQPIACEWCQRHISDCLGA